LRGFESAKKLLIYPHPHWLRQAHGAIRNVIAIHYDLSLRFSRQHIVVDVAEVRVEPVRISEVRAFNAVSLLFDELIEWMAVNNNAASDRRLRRCCL
jgi:hypothetical protein